MANRFARRILSGEIASEEELKSEFKAVAKALHPDLAGPEFHADFVRARAEYEAALRDFDRHLFASSGRDGEARLRTEECADFPTLYAELGLLLKRGFPKAPRHEKEALRYGYARWRFVSTCSAMSEAMGKSFARFETELLGLDKTVWREGVIEILGGLVEYGMRPLSALRTSLELDSERFRAEGLLSPDSDAFLAWLVSGLGDGRALR